MIHTAYLLLGSNQGNRTELLQKACTQIMLQGGELISASSLYESEPWGFHSDEWFVNQVLCIKTTLSPELLLSALQKIERDLGRVRKETPAYESRTMDIDILFYDDIIVQTALLVIPHPRLHERRFTLLPLVEIAPNLLHPTLQKNITTLLNECSDSGVVRNCFTRV